MSTLSIKMQKHFCSDFMNLGGSILKKISIFVEDRGAIRYSETKNVVQTAFGYTN